MTPVPASGAWRVRVAHAADWERSRDLRLEMLADTPIAYGRTLAWAQGLTDDDWRATGARADEDGTHVAVVEAADGRWLGTAIGKDFAPAGEEPLVEPGVVSVYVAPELRGQGALAALMAEVTGWLRSRGRASCSLLVHEDNARAIRAYEKLGFRATGGAVPYVNDPTRRELEYRLAL